MTAVRMDILPVAVAVVLALLVSPRLLAKPVEMVALD
tara:strand:- start:485 stop:595 length:111 start_codon:yes stop_codon:yes gene_type:complete